MSNEVPGTLPRKMYKEVRWEDEYGRSVIRHATAVPSEAEVVSSEIGGSGMHAPTLDIDVPAVLVPSSTAGHYHLYIDVPMTWRQYKRLLKALARAGIIEKGYMKASIRRRHTAVRAPWVTKRVNPF